MMNQKVQALRLWMEKNGCLIHKSLQIPSNINGVQGISTNSAIPHKTLIIAVPSKLILTVTKCYKSKQLIRLFEEEDDLFDYESSQDAQFNVLCVFMMYHKLNLEKSQWKEYLNTIAEPETAVDWSNEELKGLNKSVIEEIIHVRRQCGKLEKDLVKYLLTTKEFKEHSQEILRKTFNYCYRSVMTRCFGYYFNQACLIPIADLINHGCQAVDHQLIHLNYQHGKQFYAGYTNRKNNIDCTLLGLPTPNSLPLPFRQQYLVQNQLIQHQFNALSNLDRQTIDQHIYQFNSQKLLTQTVQLEDLNFCSENQDEDNDTDQEFQAEQVRNLENCRKEEEEMMDQFRKNYVVVSKYSDVESKLSGLHVQTADEEIKIQQTCQMDQKKKTFAGLSENNKNKDLESHKEENGMQVDLTAQQRQIIKQIKPQVQPSNKQNKVVEISHENVPIQMMQDSQTDEDSLEDKWGLEDTAYFTMSTSSCVSANQQLYNSYGSRTNKFLLIWYGFAYQNNLYDSVSFRLQVQFLDKLRPPSEIVLDSYIGGQGLSFRKHDNEIVKDSEVSREFRLKRTKISVKLITFLRLFLMNFYKGQDLYKLFVTFPASLDYELLVLRYYEDIIFALYERYPQQMIKQLQNQLNSEEVDPKMKYKIRYKIIYLKEQRKLLDINLIAIHALVKIVQQCSLHSSVLLKQFYQHLPIQVLRLIQNYLIQLQKCYPYLIYKQEKFEDKM